MSAALWVASAGLATWSTPKAAIIFLILGGFFIFPITELFIRISGARSLSPENSLYQLGMQVAFVLPLSMPLLVPVAQFRLNLFYPALMILLGAHYVPFVFLYGMRLFAGLAAALLAGGILITMYLSNSFSIGAWYTGAMLLAFAVAGRVIVSREMASPISPSSI